MDRRMEKDNLMSWLNMVSFSVYDLALFLDTHPNDNEAMDYFNHLNKLRNQAIKDYTNAYGPLVLDRYVAEDCYKWSKQPWPWEGGC